MEGRQHGEEEGAAKRSTGAWEHRRAHFEREGERSEQQSEAHRAARVGVRGMPVVSAARLPWEKR
jgi:hypothetical protein